ncbi:MAG: hypothetical protein IJ053_00465, partial [Lachnospiraceae bacterium]|nr:hypothetical protein [Lachnospiraceae bacterium]
MEIVRCDKGHFYDAEANTTCPQCAAEAAGGGFGGGGATQPVFPQDNVSGYGATAPVGIMGGGETQPVDTPPGFFDAGSSNMSNGVEDYDGATQPVNMGGISGFSPVTGWLVCIEG